MKRIAQGIWSPKTTKQDPAEIPPAERRKQPRDQKHTVGIQCDNLQKITGTISTDQIGRFLITSACGNAYIMILYNFDSNANLAKAIKSQKKEILIEGFAYLHKQLTDTGIHPVLHKLDNEVSADLIEEN